MFSGLVERVISRADGLKGLLEVNLKQLMLLGHPPELLRLRTSVQRVETMIGKPDFWISNTALNFSAGPFIVE